LRIFTPDEEKIKMSANILVTGGAGYIGSHTVVELVRAGHRPLLLDNLCHSHRAVLPRLEALCGQPLDLVEADVRDTQQVKQVLLSRQIDTVIHFAGLKAVGESVAQPLRYYDNNVQGTVSLMRAMQATPARRIIFSSSATVYGNPDQNPIRENAALRPANPYGHSKAMCERILLDTAAADPSWRVAVLRYFNPVGAHPSGSLGEDPGGTPNNLMPFVTQVAAGRRDALSIFGNDYDTPDGTGLRDYIHVMDLAAGHVAALERLQREAGVLVVNLGTGQPYSVLDVVRTFERVNAQRVPHQIAPRRPGDIAACWADPGFAEHVLGWKSTRGLDDMCRDAWHWQSSNPRGYADTRD